jgi:putative transposase
MADFQRVERHVICKSDSRWLLIDEATFRSKELYNVANYQIRQSFCKDKGYISYPKLNRLLKASPYYQALPAKVSQQTLRLLDKNWQAFFFRQQGLEAKPKEI